MAAQAVPPRSTWRLPLVGVLLGVAGSFHSNCNLGGHESFLFARLISVMFLTLCLGLAVLAKVVICSSTLLSSSTRVDSSEVIPSQTSDLLSGEFSIVATTSSANDC